MTSKNSPWILLFLFPFIFSFPVRGDDSAKKRLRVVIDPGHGGDDEGAFQNQVMEKIVALKVSLELRRFLLKDSRFESILTRDKDEFVPLDSRSQKAESEKADIFISIHANSSSWTKVSGTEFYFENQNATDEESLFLANRENNVKSEKDTGATDKNSDLHNILTDLAHSNHMLLSSQLSQELLEAFKKHLNVKTRAIRQAPFRVLSVSMPATLIELGFISNPKEARWLSGSKNQKMMAQAIYSGLKSFKEKLDKIHQSPVK